jgi:hypothetical protein
VKIVGTDALEVERALLAGELVCPCGGRLRPWGHARERVVRRLGREGRRRPRRSRCGVLPMGAEGGARQDGIRHRQQPRHPLRPEG